MFDEVIVAPAHGPCEDLVVAIGEHLAATFTPDAEPVVRTSLKQVAAKLAQGGGRRRLLLIDLALEPDPAAPPPSPAGAAFDLVKAAQADAAPPACLLFCSGSPSIALYEALQPLPLCELMRTTTDMFGDATRGAERLDRLQGAVQGATAARDPCGYALLDVDVISDKALAILKLSMQGGDERQALINFGDTEFRQLVQDSLALRSEMSDRQSNSAAWSGYVGEWHRRYQALGARVTNLLQTREFSELYGAALNAAGQHTRVRFSLDRGGYDIAWESMNGMQRWLAIDSTVTRRIAFRNGLPQANLDLGDGRVGILVIGSDPEPNSPLDGPGDAMWAQEWQDRTGFAPVRGLTDEEAMFQELERTSAVTDGQPTVKLTALTSRRRAGDYSLKDELAALLAPFDATKPGARRPFDIVHFAGHAVFPRPEDPDARGYLVLAGKPYNYTLPLGTFAQWLSRAGVRMAYLSCCSGSAARATLDLADNLVPMALGFSWDLEGQGAARFAKTFYTTLLQRNLKVCTAFQETKTAMYQEHRDGDPIWAAPVLVAQPNDWSRVEVCLGSGA